MAEHRKTDFTATITWMGRVPENRPNIRAQPITEAVAGYAGFEGDYHAGLTRGACVRVSNRHAKGTEIRNTRQLSILSAEELAQIAQTMGLDRVAPEHLGASMVIEGIPDFTHVPPAARLQAASGATLVIDVENGPPQTGRSLRAGLGDRLCSRPRAKVSKTKPPCDLTPHHGLEMSEMRVGFRLCRL